MTAKSSDLSALLPAPMPDCRNRRMLLFAVRRMAVGGVNDAHAAHAMLGWFGLGFRRPLVLVRAMMLELSRASERKIMVAPCCCRRLTATERELVQAVAIANMDPAAAHSALTGVLGVPNCLGVLGSAQALSQAFTDLGRAFEKDDCA